MSNIANLVVQSSQTSWIQRISRTVSIASTLLVGALFSTHAVAFNVQVATAPDNTLPLILEAIGSAKQSLLVNVYELASPEVAQALIDQINRGIHVEILQEGEPVGGIPAASRGLHAQIAHAMETHRGCCRYSEMHKEAGGTRRFRFDHAKYIVIDQSSLLLGSENYSSGGQPEPGTLGNRGWEVLVFDTQPARWFAQVFATDSDPRQPDILSLLRPNSVSNAIPPMQAAPRRTGRVNPMLTASDGEIITSPDTSQSGLVGLIRNARRTLDIEQMSFNMNWGTNPSPLFTEIVAAARRGVHVRILLNDEYAFMNGGGTRGGTEDGTDGNGDDPLTMTDVSSSGKTTANRKTVEALLQLAHSQHLPIEARIANLKAMGVAYIHNKGMIVDGNITLISSINWTQNSITNNREAALALTSPQIAAYYGQAFNQDWTKSDGTRSYLMSALSALSALSELNSPIVAPPACPSNLAVSAKIGNIRAFDDLDPSYLALQQQTLSGIFIRDLHDKRCILLGPGNLVLELRMDHDGGIDADLEGYTASMKPFSVRADFATGASSSAQGYVLEGVSTGGGRKRRLGAAELNIQVH